MSFELGSLAWGAQTGGRLSRGQEVALLVRSVPQLAALGRSWLALALGRGRGKIVVDPAAMTRPG